MTRIALIHATPAAVEPIRTAFAQDWPEPDLVNLLDDSLSRDRALAPDLTDAMYDRFDVLGRYALSFGADGILFTCSAFGPAIERVAQSVSVPVLKPNEAMFAEAIAIGGRIGMLATFEPSIASMATEFEADAAKASAKVTLESRFVPDAMAALLAGGATDTMPWSPRPAWRSLTATRSCSPSSRWRRPPTCCARSCRACLSSPAPAPPSPR